MCLCVSSFHNNNMDTINQLFSSVKWLFLALADFLQVAVEIIYTNTPDTLLKPGLSLYEYLELAPDSHLDYGIIVWVSLFTWMTLIRILYITLGRYMGYYNPNHYARVFLWVLPWRPFYKLKTIIDGWREEMFKFGKGPSAKSSSSLSILCKPYKPGHALIGRARLWGCGLNVLVGQASEKHIVYVGQAGSSKTSQMLSEVLLDEMKNYFIVDPKNDYGDIGAERLGQGGNGIKGRGGQVHIFAPFEEESAEINPFDVLRWAEDCFGPDSVVRFAEKLAEGLVPLEGTTNDYFPKAARDFATALILLVHCYFDIEDRNLVTLRRLITEGLPDEASENEDPIDALFKVMASTEAYEGIIAGKANTLAQGSDRASADVLSTLRIATSFMDYPEIRKRTKSSTFHLPDLKEKDGEGIAFIMQLPAGDLAGPLSNLIRSITVLTLYIFETLPGRSKHGCTFLLEEATAIGNIAAIENAAPLMRSMGVHLRLLFQDIEGVQKSYPKSWGGLLGNAQAVIFFGANHLATAQYIEQSMGENTHQVKIGGGKFSKKQAHTIERRSAALTADQARRYLGRKHNIIAILEGSRPMLLKAAPYFKYLPIYYYKSPGFKEKPLRAISRWFLQMLSEILSRRKRKKELTHKPEINSEAVSFS